MTNKTLPNERWISSASAGQPRWLQPQATQHDNVIPTENLLFPSFQVVRQRVAEPFNMAGCLPHSDQHSWLVSCYPCTSRSGAWYTGQLYSHALLDVHTHKHTLTDVHTFAPCMTVWHSVRSTGEPYGTVMKLLATCTHSHTRTPTLFHSGRLSMWHSAWSTGELYGRALRDLLCTAEQCCRPVDRAGCSRWEGNRRRAGLLKWSEQGSSCPWECPGRSPPGCWCCSGRYVCGKLPAKLQNQKGKKILVEQLAYISVTILKEAA